MICTEFETAEYDDFEIEYAELNVPASRGVGKNVSRVVIDVGDLRSCSGLFEF
jgi:hypothetical protein